MAKFSEQDLKYAAELREEIHKEALAIVRKTRPEVTEVIDRHPVEDYFQETWEYPGRWYTVVAIPYGYKNRKTFVDTIVRDTLSGKVPDAHGSCDLTSAEPGRRKLSNQLDAKPDDDPFYQLLAEYPDLVLDYSIVKDEEYSGYESHRKALKTAFGRLDGDWDGDPDKANGKLISARKTFSSHDQRGKLSYRKAFLCPPYDNGYTDKDFERVNEALFPNGTEGLEVYEWNTDWSDYFDDGHEWWGTLCLTVYDKTLDRFAVIMASATD